MVLVAIIGYGVATTDSSDGSPVAAPVTSTSVTASTPRVPTTTVPDGVVPYYAADPPREFTVTYANVQQLDHAPYVGYGYQLWATDGASATSGSWFSVMTYPGASRLSA